MTPKEMLRASYLTFAIGLLFLGLLVIFGGIMFAAECIPGEGDCKAPKPPSRLCTGSDEQRDCDNPPREPLPPCIADSVCLNRSRCIPDNSPEVFGCCAVRGGGCDTANPRSIEVFGGVAHGWPLLLDRKTATYYASINGISLSAWPLGGVMSMDMLLEISEHFTAETGDREPLFSAGLYVSHVTGEPRLYSAKNPVIRSGDFISNLGAWLELLPAASLGDKRRWGK